MSLTAAPMTASVGSNVTLHAQVTQGGPDTTDKITVLTTLPPAMTFVSATSDVGSSFVCTAGAGTVSCSVNGTIPVGSVRGFTLVLNAKSAAVATVSMSASSGFNCPAAKASVNITIQNPFPALANITPNSAITGSAAFTLTLTGTNFISASVAQWNGAARVTTFDPVTKQLRANILLSDLAVPAGTVIPVTVFTPGPGGGTSNSLPFTIQPKLPQILTFTPTPPALIAGHPAVLSWTTLDATSASIDQGIGPVPVNGSVSVSPIQTTAYTLTASNSIGQTVTRTIQITVTQPPIVSIVVTPNPGTTIPGGSIGFSAVALDIDFKPIPIQPTFTWGNANPTVGSTNASGVFVAAANAQAGTYVNEVSATVGAVTGRANVQIVPGPMSQIVVTPNPGVTSPGGTVTFSAVARDSAGNAVSPQPAFTWSNVHSVVGSITPAGGVFTASVGAVAGSYINEVTATAGAVSGLTSVTIVPGAIVRVAVTPNPGTTSPNGQIIFSAQAFDVANNVVPTVFAWSSVTPAIGAIHPVSGLFTATLSALAGSYSNEVRATAAGVTGTAGVVIQPGSISRIDVTPNPGITFPGGQIAFTAIAKDSAGNVLTSQPAFAWSNAHAAVGSINASGLLTASAGALSGSYSNEVTASANGVSGNASVNIIPGTITQIIVTPNPGVAAPGGAIPFTAQAQDVAGNPVIPQPTFTWSNARSTVGSIHSTNGAFVASVGALAGTYANEVTATAGAVSGHAGVTIIPGALVRIVVTPNPGTTIPGGSIAFTAQAQDIAGNPLSPQPSLVWSNIHGAVGSVNASGVFSAAAGALAGSYVNEVAATAGAITGRASVNIIPGAIVRVTVTPNPGIAAPGSAIPFTAQAFDAANNAIATGFTWTAAHAAVGSIDSASGLFTAASSAKTGSYANEVTANAGGVSGSAAVTIIPGAIVRVAVSPNPGTATPGSPISFNAQAFDGADNLVSAVFAWTRATPAVGSINASGLFTAAANAHAGTYTNEVTATVGSVSGSATVQIIPGPIVRVVVAPNPGITTPGGTILFNAQAFDAADNLVSTAFTWSRSTIILGSIDASGLFTASVNAQAGTYTNEVTATASGVSGRAAVKINPGTITRVVVTPSPASTTPGGTINFSAQAFDGANNLVDTVFTWINLYPSVGSINSVSGVYKAAADALAGNYADEVVAMCSGGSGRAIVAIIPGPIVRVAVTPNPGTTTPGNSVTFSAQAFDAANNVVTTPFVWARTLASVGSINASGIYTAAANAVAGTYTNDVSATASGIVGRASVVIAPGPFAQVKVTPNPGTTVPGGQISFNAVAQDAVGNAIVSQPVFIWSNATAALGSVNASGVFTAAANAVSGAYANEVVATAGAISGKATVFINPGPFTQVKVTPNPGTTTPGGQISFSAVAQDAAGNAITVQPTFSWSNATPTLGSINASGRFTAAANAVASTYTNEVTATAGGISGKATVIVIPGAYTQVKVTPNPGTTAPGGQISFSAVAQDAAGNAITVQPTFTWSNARPAVGSIDASGVYTAAANAVTGSYANEVTATATGISGKATVVIIPGAYAQVKVTPNPGTTTPGGQISFSAVAQDAAGNAITVQPTFSWSNATSALGSMNASGRFTAAANAVASTYTNEVTATAGGISGKATVIVIPGAYTQVKVTPNPGTTAPGGQISFSAVAQDAAGNAITVQPTFVWSRATPALGSINASGLFTAAANAVASTYTNEVTATAGGISGKATVIVIPGTYTQVKVTPNPGTTTPGGQISFSAVAQDAAGNAVTVQPTFAWSNARPAVGSIDASGVYTAAVNALAGSYANEVTATATGISGKATVVIVPGAYTQVKVTPNPGTTTPGGQISFVAVAQDAAGNAITVQPTFSWSNATAALGSVNASGLFTAAANAVAATYTNEVTATAGGISGQATVTIIPGAFTQVKVTPNPGTTVPGGQISFSAVAQDAAGNAITVQPTFSWTNARPAVGSINASGIFTSLANAAAGTYSNEVTATAGGISGKATVMVVPGTFTQVKVTPNPGTTVPDGQINFVAVAQDAAGNAVVPQPTFSWSNATAVVGSINTSGLFTAAANAVAGTYATEVTATATGISGKATVVIIPGAYSQVKVTPNPGTTTPGGQISFSAVAQDAAGNAITVQPTFSWSNATTALGSVNASGVFTAAANAVAATYTNEVTATAGGISGNATVIVIPGAYSQVKVTPNPGTTAPGGQISFSAVAQDAAGNAITVQPTFAWSNARAAVGSIDAAGVYTAVVNAVAGTYSNEVTATAGGISGKATVIVVPGPFTQVKVTPNPGTTVPGGQINFVAVAQDAAGNAITVQPTFSWINATLAVGSVNASGRFTAVVNAVAGTYADEVTATATGISGKATVVIIPGAYTQVKVTPNPGTTVPGGQISFSAVAQDAAGNAITVQPTFVWSNAHAAIGSVNASGLFAATASAAAGTYSNEVTATGGAISGKATVIVVPGTFTQVKVTPNPGTTVPGGQISFVAVAQDAAGNAVVPQPAFVWSNATPSVGSVNASGLFTAVANAIAGTYANEVTATATGISGQATVNIIPGAYTQVNVTPNPGTTVPGGQINFVAIAQDAAGNAITVQPTFSWSNATSVLGSVNASGLFTAAANAVAGTYSNEVTATAGGISGKATVTVIPGVYAQVKVTPNPGTTAPGGQISFSAVAQDAAGNAITVQPTFSWSNARAAVGSIDAAGVYTAVANAVAGTYSNEVTATAGAISGKATVIVVPGTFTQVKVTPNPGTTVPGGQINFVAVAQDAAGNAVVPQPTFSWINATPTVGAVNASGRFTAVANAVAGTYTDDVTASATGISGKATVVIIPGVYTQVKVTPNPGTTVPGGQISFSAVAQDAAGNAITVQPTFSWTTAHAAVGAVNISGLFTASANAVAGTYSNEVTATAGGISGKATVIVTPGTFTQVKVTPNPGTTTPGGQINFVAVAQDAAGNAIVTQPTFNWSSATPGVGSVNATGTFNAAANAAAGTYANEVTATGGGISGSATVIVVPGPFTQVKVTPNPGTTVPGGQISFVAVALDAAGNPITVQPTFSWNHATSAVGAINASGLFTAAPNAVAATYTNEVTATAGGISGQATVIVTPGTYTQIKVTPNPGTTAPGGQISFSAVAQDAAGNAIVTQPTFSWSNAHSSIGSINASGVFAAASNAVAGTYSNEVTATGGGLSGNATVIVIPGPFTQVKVTPNPGTTVPGGMITFHAVAQDAAGNAIVTQPSFSWSNVHAALGSINASGVFTAAISAHAGTSPDEVTATASGISGTATVVIVPGAFSKVEVTPNPASVHQGNVVSFTAVAEDMAGNPLTVQPTFAWTSATPALGSIDPVSGVLTIVMNAPVGSYANEVTATAGGLSGTAQVDVLPALIDRIEVMPDGRTIFLDETLPFVAVAYDSQNRVINGVVFSWSSSRPEGSLSAGGVFRTSTRFVGSREFRVYASAIGTSGSARVTVLSRVSGSQSDNCAARAYPVPYKVSSGLTDVTFGFLAEESKIEIYSSDARIVRKLESIHGENVPWDLKNSDGDSVASGVYFYTIRSNGGACSKKDGKLVIIK